MKPQRNAVRRFHEHEDNVIADWIKKAPALELPPARDQVIDNVEQPETAPSPRVKKVPLSDDPEVQYNIRITESVRQRLKALVKRERRPMADLISEMVDAWERQHKRS